ncbi:SnoaL-like domain protein [compost metagenome]|jgi:hypothetical protein|uniref:nuclear transport factor 2 family protein n=2 Tax=Rhizobiaceae TaxID=82115 RepID=UPI000729A394|nr:hypothetical protein N183_20500 [Sinorhizobium sp. Sb3]SDA77662.1 SnoaL-like domain-containing protein [Sinorhizobium sp. NFACC03]
MGWISAGVARSIGAAITWKVIGFIPSSGDSWGIETPNERNTSMHDFNAIAEAYIAAWNTTDAAARSALIEKAFTADVAYRDPIMQGDGHAGIDALIAGVHGQFPGFRFTLKGAADGYADTIRFSWALGPEGVASVIEGTDVCQIENGRLKTITGFLDKVPAR